MNKELLKFLTYFTSTHRIRHCIENKTRRAVLAYPSNAISNFTRVGKLCISEHNAYIIVFPWHVEGFESLVKPYVSYTRLLTYPQADIGGDIITIYHITGMRNKDYVSDFKEN